MNNTLTDTELKLATMLREFLERHGWDTAISNGHCVGTSILLMTVLNLECGPYQGGPYRGDGWHVVSGFYQSRSRSGINDWHAWNRKDDLILDLTADQFEDNPRLLVTSIGDARYRETERDWPTGFSHIEILLERWERYQEQHGDRRFEFSRSK